MKFASPLIRGRLVRRYKRFLADVDLEDGRTIVAHCPNPGAMLGLSEPGMTVWLLPSDNPKRKLAFTWELVEAREVSGQGPLGLVGVDTMLPNALMGEALLEARLPEFSSYGSIRREVAFGARSRVDFLLEEPGLPRLWLEVKNCHLSRRPGLAEFPDCAAARSARHAGVLADQIAAGDRAAIAFIVQRTDCEVFTPAGDIDPVFAAALQAAEARGLEVYVYVCTIETTGVVISRRLPYVPFRSLGDQSANISQLLENPAIS